jgi:hypothetical protein
MLSLAKGFEGGFRSDEARQVIGGSDLEPSTLRLARDPRNPQGPRGRDQE